MWVIILILCVIGVLLLIVGMNESPACLLIGLVCVIVSVVLLFIQMYQMVGGASGIAELFPEIFGS